MKRANGRHSKNPFVRRALRAYIQRMSTILSRLLAWLERNAQVIREREIDLYLSQATDAVDLENRVRNLERAVLRRNRGFAAQ